jgi:hypothetical protein
VLNIYSETKFELAFLDNEADAVAIVSTEVVLILTHNKYSRLIEIRSGNIFYLTDSYSEANEMFG